MPENIAYAEPSATSDEPARRECLRCYLVRMIRVHGCDNTRQWTIRWRDRRVPLDGQLLRQLEERGGICCDCEVVFNVWEHEGGDWQEEENAWRGEQGEEVDARTLSPCAGTSAREPLIACARWQGWSVSAPYDPGDDDDYDDPYLEDV